ncbi:MAG: hypothetical protein ACK5RZ_01215 [Akkermansiaceae bacterium]|jgi:hypothetical protein
MEFLLVPSSWFLILGSQMQRRAAQLRTNKKLPGIQLDACWNLWNLNMGKGGEIEDK